MTKNQCFMGKKDQFWTFLILTKFGKKLWRYQNILLMMLKKICPFQRKILLLWTFWVTKYNICCFSSSFCLRLIFQNMNNFQRIRTLFPTLPTHDWCLFQQLTIYLFVPCGHALIWAYSSGLSSLLKTQHHGVTSKNVSTFNSSLKYHQL